MFDDEVDETAAGHGGGKPRWHDKAKAATPATLLHHDVEVRSANGGVHRGELIAAGPSWLTIQRHAGRVAIIRTTAVVAITDEGAGGR